MTFVVGLDLGQASDPTAVAVLERIHDRRLWALRHLSRFRLGTPYTEIVEQIRLLTNAWPLKGNSHLVVDATGVGRPVMDLLRRPGLGSRLVGITIHGGDNAVRDPVMGGFRVPKREIVSNLQLLFQQRRLRIAAGLPEAEVFLTELASFQIRISTTTGHDAYSARSAEHDDLVLAVGLAAWLGQRYSPLPPGPPLEVAPKISRGMADEIFENLKALDALGRATNPNFIAIGDYRDGGSSSLPRNYQTRPGITGPIAHVIKTTGR